MTDNDLDAFDIDNIADVISEAPKALIEQIVDELTELVINERRELQGAYPGLTVPIAAKKQKHFKASLTQVIIEWSER